MVFRIASERQEFLEKVLLTIARINGRALGLNDVPDNILIAHTSYINYNQVGLWIFFEKFSLKDELREIDFNLKIFLCLLNFKEIFL